MQSAIIATVIAIMIAIIAIGATIAMIAMSAEGDMNIAGVGICIMEDVWVVCEMYGWCMGGV